jgi:hypothetical protein
MGLIPNLSRADSKDFKVNSIPSLSSVDASSDNLFNACSILSTTGNSSLKSFSTPYLWAFSTSDAVLFIVLSRSAVALKSCFSKLSFFSRSSS